MFTDGSIGETNAGTCDWPVVDASIKKMHQQSEEKEVQMEEVLDGDGGCDNANNVAQEVGGRCAIHFDGNGVKRNKKIVACVMGKGS